MLNEIRFVFQTHSWMKYFTLGIIFIALLAIDLVVNPGVDPMTGYRDGGPDFILVIASIISFVKFGFELKNR